MTHKIGNMDEFNRQFTFMIKDMVHCPIELKECDFQRVSGEGISFEDAMNNDHNAAKIFIPKLNCFGVESSEYLGGIDMNLTAFLIPKAIADKLSQ